MVAKLHAAKIHHAVHHRDLDVLALAGTVRLVQRREEPDREMQPRAGVADLRAGDEGRSIGNAGRAHRPAHRLCHVLVCLEIGIRARRAEALDRAHDELRIDLVDLFPREAEPLEDAGAEVLHHDVGLLQQVDEHLLALGRLHVDDDRALVAIEHREVERVGVRHVAQLPARGIALGRLELDHVGAHPREQLRARRARLHMRHVENANTLESFHMLAASVVSVVSVVISFLRSD